MHFQITKFKQLRQTERPPLNRSGPHPLLYIHHQRFTCEFSREVDELADLYHFLVVQIRMFVPEQFLSILHLHDQIQHLWQKGTREIVEVLEIVFT
jgi:hypothetical protein